MNRMGKRSPSWIVAAAMSAGMLAGPGVSLAQSTGDCLRVEVSSSIVLPDGSVHPAGTLELCLSRAYSPVAGLHATSVNGVPVGLLLSRRRTSEGPAREEPYVLFQRTPEGRLELLGYSWPDGKAMNTYLMRSKPREIKEPSQAQNQVIALVASVK